MCESFLTSVSEILRRSAPTKKAHSLCERWVVGEDDSARDEGPLTARQRRAGPLPPRGRGDTEAQPRELGAFSSVQSGARLERPG